MFGKPAVDNTTPIDFIIIKQLSHKDFNKHNLIWVYADSTH